GWTQETALARCTLEDGNRDRFTRYFFGDAPFQPARYHATFNTGWVPLQDVVESVAAVVRGPSTPAGETAGSMTGVGRPLAGVVTLSGELGAGETSFAQALAPRLRLSICDRELLEQEAVRLGVPEAKLEKIDEQPAGLFERFRPGSLYQRYADALGQL